MQFRNPGNIGLWNLEPWAFGMGNTAQGIRIPLRIGTWNPSSTVQNSGIHGVKSRIYRLSWIPLHGEKHYTDPSGAPIENTVQNHLNIALLNVF